MSTFDESLDNVDTFDTFVVFDENYEPISKAFNEQVEQHLEYGRTKTMQQVRDDYFEPYPANTLGESSFRALKSCIIDRLSEFDKMPKNLFQQEQFDSLKEYMLLFVQLMFSPTGFEKVREQLSDDPGHHTSLSGMDLVTAVYDQVHGEKFYEVQIGQYLTLPKYKDYMLSDVSFHILVETYFDRHKMIAGTFCKGEYLRSTFVVQFNRGIDNKIFTLAMFPFTFSEELAKNQSATFNAMRRMNYVVENPYSNSLSQLFLTIEKCLNVLSKKVFSIEASQKFVQLQDACYTIIDTLILSGSEYRGKLTYSESQQLFHNPYLPVDGPDGLESSIRLPPKVDSAADEDTLMSILKDTIFQMDDCITHWQKHFAKERDDTMQKMRMYFPHLLRTDLLEKTRIDSNTLCKILNLIDKTGIYQMLDEQ